MQTKLLEAALHQYDEVSDLYIQSLSDMGVKFATPEEAQKERVRIESLRQKLFHAQVSFRNAGASLSSGWLSKACIECTGNNGSETFSTTFACHRDCYFCFNHNQSDYEKFFNEGCPWEDGLKRASQENETLACIGLTGGEPLLNLDESIQFLEQVGEIFPDAHKRMYTSGDLLTEEGAARLRDAGLTEIRFSVKDDDTETLQDCVLSNMELAKRYIPDVVVEMPVIPGAGDRMKALFRRFAEIGIRGINLLEFCFPFCNWEEFDRRGFVVRNPPFPVMYDYGYSGGLPIAGSEALILELMAYGLEQDVPFGMHYCSLENKHRSEMRQINERGAHMHPCFEFNEGDFFLKTLKILGSDRVRAQELLEEAGCDNFLNNDTKETLCVAPRYAKTLENEGLCMVMSFNVLESNEQGRFLREIGLFPVERNPIY